MKIIFVFSVCCLAVALADPIDFNKYRRQQYEKATTECQAEFQQANKEITHTGPNRGCYDACVHKKLKVFNEDGTLNFSEIMGTRHDKEYEEHAQRVYAKCLETGNGNPCEVSYCIAHTKEF